MHTSQPQNIFLQNQKETRAPFDGQDKKAHPRLSAASPQASTAAQTALKDITTPKTQEPEKTDTKQKHSTKRQMVFAGGWVRRETDAYIEHRLKEERKVDPKLSRSSVIRQMLEERALDDTIIQQHAILAPMIRETMQSLFKEFMDRYLGLIARDTYELGKIYPFMTGAFSKFLDAETINKLDDVSETSARTNATRRTPQVDEVLEKLRQKIEEKL